MRQHPEEQSLGGGAGPDAMEEVAGRRTEEGLWAGCEELLGPRMMGKRCLSWVGA